MKKDTRKYHYETTIVHKDKTSFYVGLGQVVLGILMFACGMATATNPEWATSFWTSPYWFFPLAGMNVIGAISNLEGNMGEDKKIRIYDKPERVVDPVKETVSDKDALNDILGD